jgi:hypothetical protein
MSTRRPGFIYLTDFVKQDRTAMSALLTRLNLLAK